MADTTTNTPSSADSKERRYLILGAKFALIGLIAILMVSNTRALLGLGAPARATSAPETAIESALAPPPSFELASKLSDGYWEIADLPWRVSVTSGSAAETLRRLREDFTAGPPPVETGAGAIEAAATHAALLSAISQMGATEEPAAGAASVLRIVRPEFQAAIRVYPTARGKRIAAARFAVPSDDAWRLIEASPAAASPGADGVTTPLPRGVKLVATRRGASGEVLAQLATCDAASDAAPDAWRDADWRTREFPAEAGAPESGHRLLIEREGQAFMVELPRGEAGAILLTAAPDAAQVVEPNLAGGL